MQDIQKFSVPSLKSSNIKLLTKDHLQFFFQMFFKACFKSSRTYLSLSCYFLKAYERQNPDRICYVVTFVSSHEEELFLKYFWANGATWPRMESACVFIPFPDPVPVGLSQLSWLMGTGIEPQVQDWEVTLQRSSVWPTEVTLHGTKTSKKLQD